MLVEFVSRRGGSLLMLGGRRGLADGGWGLTELADVLPASLPEVDAPSFMRLPAKAMLTPVGRRSLLTRTPERGKVERQANAAAPTGNGTVRGGPYFVFLGGGYHGGK